MSLNRWQLEAIKRALYLAGEYGLAALIKTEEPDTGTRQEDASSPSAVE